MKDGFKKFVMYPVKSFIESMIKVRQAQVDRMIKENGWRNLQ